MHDAPLQGTADWTRGVLEKVSARVQSGRPMPVSALAAALATTAWWDGCPRAPELAAGEPYRRVPLVGVMPAGVSALLIAWPPSHATPIHDHDGLWGIELVLDGVLEVESFTLSLEPGLALRRKGAEVLGVGDHAAFSRADYAHRCRNLSAHRPALSLHIYGGELNRFQAFDRDGDGRWRGVPRQVSRDLALT
jgi:hypothetical protein